MSVKTIIGLEIHVELMTKTKIFCNCTNEFGGEANTHCCPVCLGLPGAIPILNREVVEFGIKAGLALNCGISHFTKMDRKNYFYSDLVKGYQTSQDDIPICKEGYLELELEEGNKKINLERIHIEEDTGKSVHTEEGDTLLDYNRAGVPLIEIVTKPDMNSALEAKMFLEKLRDTLKYIEVSDVKMEEGSLRCDVNINIVDEDKNIRTNISEIKNLNSFRAVEKSIEAEVKRHKELLGRGEDTLRETRRWDESIAETVSMREKSDAENYRFHLDGNIPPIEITDEWINRVKSDLPELPGDKKNRFIDEYDLTSYEAGVLTQSRQLSYFYEETVKYTDDAKLASNWIMGDVLRRLNEEEIEIDALKFNSKDLSNLLKLVKQDKINNNTGKKVLREMFETGKKPEEIVKERGLIQISDANELETVIEKVLDDNPQSIEDFKGGKDRAIGFLMGQIMKETKGKANPKLVNKILTKMIKKR